MCKKNANKYIHAVCSNYSVYSYQFRSNASDSILHANKTLNITEVEITSNNGLVGNERLCEGMSASQKYSFPPLTFKCLFLDSEIW